MVYPQKEARFSQDFRDFIGIRTAFLGLVAVISVFFPLFNFIFQTIPLEQYEVEDGVYNIFSPVLITGITTLMTLVAVFSILMTRGSYMGRGKRDAQRKAWTSIRVSIGTLIGYVIIYKIYTMYTYPMLNVSINDMRKLYFEVPLLICYASFYSHLTQTLMLVAMTKFYKKDQLQKLMDITSGH